MEMRRTNSLSDTIETAQYMLKTGRCKDDANFAYELHGEICETVLEMLLEEYVKAKPECSMQKSLILWNRKRPDNGFLTEIDWTLFAPESVYIFECKSYSGKKTLTGNGLMTRENGKQYDVYQQSIIHKETLYDWIEGFVLPGKCPLIQMCMFNFSQGVLDDQRSRSAKIEMPVLDEGNLLSFLKAESSAEKVWNVKLLQQAGEKLAKKSESLRKTHLQYVKSKHGGGV